MEKLFRREVIEAMGHGVIFSDAEQLITYANGSFCELTGYDRSEIVGRNCRFLQGPDTDPETRVRIRKALAAGQPFEGEIIGGQHTRVELSATSSTATAVILEHRTDE